MLDSQTLQRLKELMSKCMENDMVVLDTLRREIRVLSGAVRRIVPRNTTSISLVGTDGGNNKLKFDPFLVQVIKVVDSSNNEYYMDLITPTTKVEELNRRIFAGNESKLNSLKKMMDYLGVDNITKLNILLSQVGEAQQIIGYLLADAVNGFPIPFYPLSLQKAHENAALVDFDMDIIQDEILNALRIALGQASDKIDTFRLIDSEPSIYRY